MSAESRGANILPFPQGLARRPPADIGDLWFRALLSEADWSALPAAVRARFGKRISDCRTVHYGGEIVECAISGAGWCLAQLGRLIGAPLPLSRDVMVPATVCVC